MQSLVFLCYWPQQTVEQIANLPVLWDSMTLMWCNFMSDGAALDLTACCLNVFYFDIFLHKYLPSAMLPSVAVWYWQLGLSRVVLKWDLSLRNVCFHWLHHFHQLALHTKHELFNKSCICDYYMIHHCKSMMVVQGIDMFVYLWPLLLTWFNFNHSMGK